MPDSMLEDYKRPSTTADISLGGALEIVFDDMKINADYYAAVEEYDFLKRNNIFQYINKIVEIGGGFGRTCHVIMTISNIEKYVIVDLEPMLQLSRSYLKRVLPAHIFSRIQFVSSEDRVEQGNLSADLVINIDSMQEMPQSVIDLYMENIVRCAKYFYSKNAVGKYKPQTLGLNNIDEERMQDVFDLGRCRDVIDIFNDDDLRRSTNNYLAAYNPDGETWERCDHKEMEMFPYFVHALYTRKN